MEKPEAKPPNFPKPIRTQENLEREKQLKNRLKVKFGHSHTPYVSKPIHTEDDGTIKGFGEQQFVDSIHEESSILSNSLPAGFSNSFAEQSSIWTEHSKFIASRTGNAHDKYLKSATMSLQSSMLLPSETQQYRTTNIIQPNTSKFKTHLDVSESLISEGYESVVQSLISNTDFCYVENEADDFYRFGVKAKYPISILTNEFTTISARGMLRAQGDEVELVPFDELSRESMIYGKICQIKTFRTYRLWKMFYLWKRIISRNRYTQRVSLKYDNFIIFS
jgi:hypothetical protein